MTHFPIQEWRELAERLKAENQQQRDEMARLRAALDWSELRVDDTKLRWALNEFGPTRTNAEAYVKAAVEHLIYMRFKARAALKEGA